MAAIASRTAQAEREVATPMPDASAIGAAASAQQERRKAPPPDRVELQVAGQTVVIASAIARSPLAPVAAGERRLGADIVSHDVAELAVPASRRKLRALDQPLACREGVDAERARTDLSDEALHATARMSSLACDERRSIDFARVDLAHSSRAATQEPASVVIRFDAIVINFNFAGIGG